jgi:hypothetical protein
MLSIKDISDYAICPMLVGKDYNQLKDLDTIQKGMMSIVKDALTYAGRRRSRIPKYVINSRIKSILSEIHDLRRDSPRLPKLMQPYANFLDPFYSQIYENTKFPDVFDINVDFQFLIDTHYIKGVAPYLLFNGANKQLALITCLPNIEVVGDALRSVHLRGLLYGLNQIASTRYFYNYNPVNGVVVHSAINIDYITKSERVLVSLVRSIKSGFQYYGCTNCILRTCN